VRQFRSFKTHFRQVWKLFVLRFSGHPRWLHHRQSTDTRILPVLHPDMTTTLKMLALCQPILGFKNLDRCKYIPEKYQFDDFLRCWIPMLA
jgi:hypothetical protein